MMEFVLFLLAIANVIAFILGFGVYCDGCAGPPPVSTLTLILFGVHLGYWFFPFLGKSLDISYAVLTYEIWKPKR